MALVEEKVLNEDKLKKYDSTEEIERDGSGSAHTHPESEYIVVEEGYIIVSFLNGTSTDKLQSNSSVFIQADVPHQVYVCGKVVVYTTKRNLANIDRRNSLKDFAT